jgi:hypothetical protein
MVRIGQYSADRKFGYTALHHAHFLMETRES